MDFLNGKSPVAQSLTLTIPEAARLLGISVSKAYEAARLGNLPTLRVGTRVLVSRRRLQELVDGRPDHSEVVEDQPVVRF